MEATNATLIKLGKRIRALREKKKLKQEELAQRAELHTTYLSQVECGKRNISVLALLKIARVLEVDLAKLVRKLGD